MSALRNMGLADRIIRTVIGVAVIAVGVAFHSWWGLLAAVPLVTAAVGFCPLYSLLGISTRKRVLSSAA
jgi:Inner membrane protein YgaP-like, transmembrane domain